MKERIISAAVFSWSVALLVYVLTVSGCATRHGVPPGYDADTTPGQNGEAYIGGAP